MGCGALSRFNNSVQGARGALRYWQGCIEAALRRYSERLFPALRPVLSSQSYKDAIEEIRIEGHTSSMWENAPPERAYFYNMQLSQSRTRTVLEHVLGLPKVSV